MRLRSAVPDFPPVRAGGGRRRLRRGAPGRRRVLSVALAVCAAGLAVAAPDSGATAGGDAASGGGGGRTSGAASGGRGVERSVTQEGAPTAPVSAPVRIADPATVRLLSPGDRIDVLASTSKTASARVVAAGVRVAHVPKYRDTVSGDGAEGALIVVVVPRRTAAALAGAAAKSRLAVTLC
ncbi:hypothetical protein [Streptomyces sp. 891-h]|uniref:hypothetical protein n=1 Tax=unclassified Streptomyces TaxID=2593676 RepID=UPI001FA9EA35|nr:hypothetical protein [Streptomyces sp. 891-h]UNZ18828.1 hypothetical protein HC362_19065 [Streptomyces sp. 891-h]